MLKSKQGEFSLAALFALLFGSVLFVSAVVINSTGNLTNESGLIDFPNISENITLIENANFTIVNESINQSTISNETIPIEINQSTNLTLTNESAILNNTINQTINITLPEKPIKNLTKIVELNKHKLNNETEKYLKNIKNKKEEKRFIVKFRNSVDKNKLANATLEKEFDKFKVAKINGKIEDIEYLIEDDEIEFLELEQDVKILEDNIPFNIKKVKADSAWNSSKGSNVKVAVLDTGIGPHNDLLISGGVSFADNNYFDTNGHGTSVAGVISALLNDEGLVGVAPDISLYSVKIMQGSTGELSNAIAGIEWAIDNNISIVSMSFGFGSYSQIFKEALQEAYNHNILLVAASGNEGTENILYPARYDTVIAVGAVTADDNLAYFSSYGFEQELVAPGADINSTSLGNGYSLSSGTSLAAPHVAGAAALIKSFNNSLTNEQIRAKLRNDALDLGDTGKDDLFGYGLVQVNLNTTNYTFINLSYFYEVFNITDFRLPNQTLWFWLNGTGTIDDVKFRVGYYLVNITHNSSFKKSYIYNVTENGSIFVLGTTIEHDDNYIYDGSSNSDGIAWINDNITVRVTSTTVPTPEGECYWIDGGVSGRLNYCFFDNTAHKNECDSDPDITCGSETNCQIVDTLISQYREIINYASARSGSSRARVYDDCTTPGSGIENSETLNYYVIDKKRWRCTGSLSYVAEGWYGTNWVTIDTDSCPTGQVCVDSANITTETYSIDPYQNPPPEQICSGTISAIVTDSKNSPLTNVKVYSNSIFNGSVDNDGSRSINYTNVNCGGPQNITIKCSDDTTCDSKSSTVDSNGDYDSLTFSCNICINKTDLSIKTSDITIKSQGNKYNITALINIEKVSQNNVQVYFRGENLRNDFTLSETKTININQYQYQNVSVLWDLNKTDFISVYVDFNNVVAEIDESNNYVRKSARPATRAYVDVSTDYPVIIDSVKNYLSQYIDIVSQGSQEVNIYVGRKNSNIPKGEQVLGKEKNRWGLINNIVKFNSKSEGLPYNGIAVKKDNNIYVFGNEIDGDLAALRKIVDNQEFYFSKSVPERIDYISEEDLDGLFVFDYLHTDENQAKYRLNNNNFAKVVENVLNSDVSTLAIKRVLTYNDNTSLRIKHVNAELGPKYKNFSNPQPVVLQRGIHSNLFTWEDFGFDLARGQVAGVKDNKPRDVWLTELVGGPNTECSNCPVYTFDNLSTYYWPALIAGVQKYSNQNNLSYVGYSLGCSVALDSLEKYNVNGKTQAGYYNNGSEWVNMSMSANPIDTFVGIACPGNFTKLSTTFVILNSSKSFVFDHFRKVGKNHTNLDEIKRRVLSEYQIIASLLLGQEYYQIIDNVKNSLDSAFPLGGNNMSIEIYYEFFRWMNDSDGPHLGKNVSINNVAIFQGTVGRKLSIISQPDRNTDSIIPNDDLKEICKNIDSNNKYYINFPNRYHFGKEGLLQSLPEDGEVKSLIKKFLDTNRITDSFFDFNNYDLLSNSNNCE